MTTTAAIVVDTDPTTHPSSSASTPPPPPTTAATTTQRHRSRPIRQPLPTFTLESGLIPILYYTSQAAPTPSIRRRAIAVLRRANLREGLWGSRETAALAARELRASGGRRRPIYGAAVKEMGKQLWSEQREEEGVKVSVEGGKGAVGGEEDGGGEEEGFGNEEEAPVST